MVVNKFTAAKVELVAPAILLNVILSGEDCHCIVPVFPANVNVVLFVPEHTVAAPEIVPATGVWVVITTLPLKLAAGAVHAFPSLNAVILYVVVVNGDTAKTYGEVFIPVITTGVTPLV